MKKFALLALVSGLFILASCNKEKDCTCVQAIGGVAAQTTTVTTKEDCKDLNTSTSSGGITTTLTCEEK